MDLIAFVPEEGMVVVIEAKATAVAEALTTLHDLAVDA